LLLLLLFGRFGQELVDKTRLQLVQLAQIELERLQRLERFAARLVIDMVQYETLFYAVYVFDQHLPIPRTNDLFEQCVAFGRLAEYGEFDVDDLTDQVDRHFEVKVVRV